MNKKELENLLEKLHAELDAADNLDEKGRQLLRDIDKDISEVLQRSDRGSVLERLREAIKQFEVSHPALTSMLSEISTILSNAGI
jgi:predicted translin family RNA/ssDNA-binding protein